MDRNTNLRKTQVTTASGKDVQDTQQLKGEAKPTKSATNETVQYTQSFPSPGPLGGRNSGS